VKRERSVNLEPVVGPINRSIDDAYLAKYHDSPYLSPMINAGPLRDSQNHAPRDNERLSMTTPGVRNTDVKGVLEQRPK
jgi:hypothetical protein